MSPTVAKKNPGNRPKKTRRVVIRVDPDWEERVTAAAQQEGLSLAGFIRQAVFEKMERKRLGEQGPAPPPPKADP